LRTYCETEMRLQLGPISSNLPVSSAAAGSRSINIASNQRHTAATSGVFTSSAADGDDGLIRSNCRPVQPRGTRRIRIPPPPTYDDAHCGGGFATALHSRRTVSLLPGRSGSIVGDDLMLHHHQQPFLVQPTARLAVARMATFPTEVIGQ
jgi:hypothetical protein